jgi:hypothetical protein
LIEEPFVLSEPELTEKVAIHNNDLPDRIHHCLIEAGQRFHVNDSISDLINDGGLDELRIEIEHKLQGDYARW